MRFTGTAGGSTGGTSLATDELLRLRPEFPILEKTTYLISNSLGAMPRAAAAALAEYVETWATRGVRAWAEGWWEMSAAVGDEIAPLIGASAGSVTMLPNVTIAAAVLLSSLDFRPPRHRIVMVDGEFPTVRYLVETLGPRLGAEIVVVPSPGGDGLAADESRIRGAIDGRTALVLLSHVLFKSAFVLDVAAVAEKCRREGATIAVDGYQSVGTLRVAVDALGVDALVGGVLKWLCGGPGGAFLWVRPELRPRLHPSLTGWMAHPAPFDFDAPPMRWRDDAFRFLLGTPAIPALYAAREGPRIVRAAGIDAIRKKSLTQTSRLLALADARGFRSPTPRDPARRGGTVAVDFENALEVSRELNARDVVVDYRPGAGIRMSPHFYTADAELDRAFDAIDEIRASRSWERWVDRPTVVT
jgi:kynureninase